MAELVEGLAARGHEITIFASSRDPDCLPEAPLHRVPIWPRPALARYVSFLVGNSALRAWFRWRHGVRFNIVHSTGADVLRPTITTLHCCAAAMANDVASSGGATTWQRWSVLRRWTNRISYEFIALVERYVTRRGARATVAVSGVLASQIAHYNAIDRGRVRIIPNGVSLDEFHPGVRMLRQPCREEMALPQCAPVVLFVGYNLQRKGLLTLVQAMTLLAQGQSSLHPWLVVVGGRGQAPFEQAVTLELEGRVRFVGATTDMSAFYGMSDVCVLPTREEPFGLPILEAMACGLPTIVSACAGVAELMTDGLDGLLLEDPNDPRELAVHLRTLLEDKSIRERMGTRARETAECYSWHEIARLAEALYCEVSDGTS